MLVRPDGKKKAYVRLTADFDALEVANKVGLTTTGSQRLTLLTRLDRLHLIGSLRSCWRLVERFLGFRA
jgi:hypothetical protein